MLIRLLILLVTCIMGIQANTTHAGTLFVTKERTLSQQEERLVGEFTQELQEAVKGRDSIYIPAVSAGSINGSDNIIVALGDAALDKVLSGPGDSPVIGVFVNRSTFGELISGRKVHRQVSAIYAEPSATRQLALIKALLGDGASVSIIKSPHNSSDLGDAVNAAKGFGVKYKIIDLARTPSTKAFADSLNGARTLFLQKDKDVFSSISLDTLLLLAYDLKNVGIVGYSSGVVKNGALATTYSSLEDTARSVAYLVSAYDASGKLANPDYPKYFSVVVNKYVVRSLDLKERSPEEIKQSIFEIMRGGI